jgi:hypothetical protein
MSGDELGEITGTDVNVVRVVPFSSFHLSISPISTSSVSDLTLKLLPQELLVIVTRMSSEILEWGGCLSLIGYSPLYVVEWLSVHCIPLPQQAFPSNGHFAEGAIFGMLCLGLQRERKLATRSIQ